MARQSSFCDRSQMLCKADSGVHKCWQSERSLWRGSVLLLARKKRSFAVSVRVIFAIIDFKLVEWLNIFHRIPAGTEIRELTPDHSSRCNSIWDFRYEGSEGFIKSLIELNGGLGLFDRSTNELLSYALINDSLAIGMLNTVEYARGKGYAALVTKLISIKIAQDFDIHPTAYIGHSRTSSNKLFGKLGFKKIGDCDWILINKRE